MTEQIVDLEPNYKPSPDEEYMCPQHLEYFRRKLIEWRDSITEDAVHTLEHLKQEEWNQKDPSDQASLTEENGRELRTTDRQRKLILKIDAALKRIADGDYGYCEETRRPIGIGRLEARPIATLCLEAQERHEQFERTHSDDTDEE